MTAAPVSKPDARCRNHADLAEIIWREAVRSGGRQRRIKSGTRRKSNLSLGAIFSARALSFASFVGSPVLCRACINPVAVKFKAYFGITLRYEEAH
jgi:hypothetical protein